MVQQNLTSIQIGKESTAGTETSTYVQYPGIAQRGDVSPTIQEAEILVANMSGRLASDQALHGESTYGLTTNIRLQTGQPFYWLMGAVSTTGSGTPYTHAISNNNTVPSFSVEYVIDSDHSHKFLGCKLDSLEITLTQGQPVSANLSWVAESHSIDTSPGSPSSRTLVPYEFHQLTTLTVNSVSYLADIRQATISMSNGLERDYSLSSRDASSITEGVRECTMNLEIRASDETLMNLLKNRTDFAISFVLKRAGSDNDKITITINNAKIFAPSYDFGGNAIVDVLPVRVIGNWTVSVLDALSSYAI
jgi:hypothetical protein